METVELTVVIPCYNEMANFQKGVLEKVDRFLSRQEYSYEVLIVDDGSNDGSVAFVENFVKETPHFRLLQNPHLGKAGAVTAGMLNATGLKRLFTDMDQATPIEELKKLLPFSDEYDIVIGSRQSKRHGAPWTRKLMAQGMITLRKILVGVTEIEDTQCGFKLFKKEAAEKLFQRLNDFHHGYKKIYGSSVTAGFDAELLYLAKKMCYTIKEVPVEWFYVETRRVSPIKDSIEGLRELLKIRFNAAIHKY